MNSKLMPSNTNAATADNDAIDRNDEDAAQATQDHARKIAVASMST